MYKEQGSGIYQIRNLKDNKIYIGSSISLKTRKNRHFSELSLNKHHNNHLQRAFNRDGKNNFVFEILIVCHPSMLTWYEQQFVDSWNPEYNQRKDVTSNMNIIVSNETKEKIGKFFRGRNITESHKRKISFVKRFIDPPRSKTGYKGVTTLPNNKYRAMIYINGKQTHLGVFSTANDASNAYIKKAKELKGGYQDL